MSDPEPAPSSGMHAFAALTARLENARDEETAVRALAAWLADAPGPERGVALGFLVGATPIRRVGRKTLGVLADRLDPVLLAIARETTGDPAESIALMWPGPPSASAGAPTLAETAAALADAPPAADRLAAWLDALPPAARVTLLRLATGHVAGLLPARTAQAALALHGGVPLADIEAVWHATAPPYADLFAWLEGRAPRPAPARAAPFKPLARVRLWSEEDRHPPDSTAIGADAAWAGLRVLAISHGGARRLYSRRGVDVGARFPELLELLDREAALEGVILMRDAGGRYGRAALEARLGRRPRKETGEPVLMLHDVLELSGEDLRRRPLRARRETLLTTIAPLLPPNRAAISPLTPLSDWSALPDLKKEARALGAVGVILKALDAPYAADEAWVEQRCDPIRFSGVLLYVEYALDGMFATVGVWDGGILVPIAKVPLDDAELAAQVTAYASAHPFDRFGPVLQVTADLTEGLVLDVAFDAIERAPRRKAGVQLAGARLLGVPEQASSRDAAQLEELRALLG